VEQAWSLIVEKLTADGWVRLDNSIAAGPNDQRLMYFGIA
jgi:hypothetical protein